MNDTVTKLMALVDYAIAASHQINHDYAVERQALQDELTKVLAKADKQKARDIMAVHKQMVDKYTPVLKMALEALVESCGARCNAEYNPCHARLAADAIRKVLG